MKRLKKFFYIALSLCLLFQAAPTVSAKEEPYTYTIRFFSGKQGYFEEGEVIALDGLAYGTQVSFSQSMVILNDNSKYYIRGIRESGKDNSETVQTPSFVVTGDQDYVVAYGILGDATSYTINYVDEEGNALAPSETYYGNVGDRPVVAYIYIEGWVPQAYNLTQTLEKDPAENVFDFIYTREQINTVPVAPIAPVGPTPGTPAGVTVVPPAPAAPVGTPEGGDAPAPGGDAGAPDDGTPDAGTPDGGDDEEEGTQIPDNETPTGNAPDQLRDLDDDLTPASNFLTVAADARLLGIPVPVVIVVVLGAVAAAWYFLMLKRKKKEEKS